MPYKCPECDNKIERLCYNVDTSGREYGTAHLSDEKFEESCQIITDHDYDDSGDTQWSGDCEYECPECDASIDPEDLIWVGDDEDDEEDEEDEENEKPKDLTNDEEKHNIIKPKEDILSHENPKDTSKSTIVCKNKRCKHIFVCDKVNSFSSETFFECPNCGETNIVEKY